MTPNARRNDMWITGVGAVSPFGPGLSDFMGGLREGRSGTHLLHQDLRSEKISVGATAPDDPKPEGWTDADTQRVPRLVPMAVRACREAMTAAGLPTDLPSAENPDATAASRRIGLVLGTGGGGIDFTLRQAAIWNAGKRPSLWTITNATHGNLAGELSIWLGLRGPSLCISTGCASSSDAIGRALEMLRMSSVTAGHLGEDAPGVLDAVVVVGADAHLCEETLASMDLLGVISRRPCESPADAEAVCRPFDESRDGFVLGEGAWALVLERKQPAERRNATPIGHLLGYAATCDAYHRVRPEPSMAESARAIQTAIADAGLEPQDIEGLLYHGTGTPTNDAAETSAVKLAFQSHAENLRGSSIKGAIGHPQGACGAASAVAALGALAGVDGRAPFFPPTINLNTPDPRCDLEYTPNAAVPTDTRTVLVNCLAFGAKNSAFVLRARPPGD